MSRLNQLETIKEYIRLLIMTYELDENELLSVWTRVHPLPSIETLDDDTDVAEFISTPSLIEDRPVVTFSDEKMMQNLKLPGLKKLCKEQINAKQ